MNGESQESRISSEYRNQSFILLRVTSINENKIEQRESQKRILHNKDPSVDDSRHVP